jgi:hypothetical protein
MVVLDVGWIDRINAVPLVDRFACTPAYTHLRSVCALRRAARFGSPVGCGLTGQFYPATALSWFGGLRWCGY